MYNDSESIVGKSVGHRREEYFLATKAGTGRTTSPDSEWTYEKIKTSVEKSLKNLQTDVIDLVQLHSCETHLLEQGDVIRALQDCKIEGKTRFIGYSGDNEAADWAVRSNLFDTLQTSYSLSDQRARSRNILSEANFVAPYKLDGALALSVDKATIFFTPESIQASIRFIAPLIFVLIHSKGLYSAIGTIFAAAA